MLGEIYSNPAVPFFEYAKRVASNIAPYGEKGDYTAEMFQADFPQFYQKTNHAGEDVYTPLAEVADILKRRLLTLVLV